MLLNNSRNCTLSISEEYLVMQITSCLIEHGNEENYTEQPRTTR
jgi:hypothetical protein